MDYTKIREYRQRDSLSLHQLAAIVGVSYAYLNNLERGNQKEIKNLIKRESVERWLKNAEKRHGKPKRVKHSTIPE